MIRLAEKIKQRRYETDVTNRLLNGFGACLTRKSNQERNARCFFEHCFFPKKMMRAQAVAVVARVHNNRVVGQAASFNAGEDCANALIYQCDQPEIALLDTPVFLRGDAKEQLSLQSLPVANSFRLLPFAHQTVTQRNIFTFSKRGCRIEFDAIERILIVERSVVR